ncbi:protein ARV1 [Nematostella vectensis]|uniref:protein ARV1 n=1 Tax=Nematostella vectensis TaxID=45351 RepID=UPI002076D962|nr:protein ARV1 [Nematostella vectensis]XP_032242190.2 protein ARV1 [Nematostella vectensis]XP_048589630.1 protein ARV1 [Nematostella vectensis]
MRSGKVCVECGENTASNKLFRKFQGGAVRLLFCEHCSKVMDKYLEFDPVLVFLDVLLLKPQAFRHVLMNLQPQIHWQLCMLYLLSNAYTKWCRTNQIGDSASHHDHTVLELKFYWMMFLSCVELIAFFLGVFLSIKFLLSLSKSNHQVTSFRDIVRTVLLSSFGKLLFVPVVVWGGPSVQTGLLLTRLLVFASTTVALGVTLKIPFTRASLVVGAGCLCEVLTSQAYVMWDSKRMT